MTAEELEDDETPTYPSSRMNLWLFVSIFTMFFRNLINAFVVFWEDLTDGFVAHANYKNEQKKFSESVLADIQRL